MPVPCSCGCDDRCECGCPQDCEDCAYIVYLEDGKEWPAEGLIRCWSCLFDSLQATLAILKELRDAGKNTENSTQRDRLRAAKRDADDVLRILEA